MTAFRKQLRLILMFLGGLVLAGAGLLVAMTLRAGPAETAGTCSAAGGVYSVVLGAGTTTLSLNATGGLSDSGLAPAPTCGTVAPTSIVISVPVGTVPASLVLDETGAGGAFACSANLITGAIGTAGLEVDGGPGDGIIAGTLPSTATGVNTVGGSCNVANVDLTQVSSYKLVAGSGTDTLSTGGGSGTGTAITGTPATFVAGGGADTFTAGAPASSLDFSNVGTSGAAPLTINASGVPQNPGTGLLVNGEAEVGATSYSFLNAGGGSASNFINFTGPSSGNTAFLTGTVGGLTFTGGGAGNSAYFFGNPNSPSGVVVNLSGGSQTTSALLGAGKPLSNFTLGSGQVLVGTPGTATSCTNTPLLSTYCDSVVDVTDVTGPTTGYGTFYAGADDSTFSDSGDHNTFYGGTGSDTFISAGNFNDYVAGAGSDIFEETGSGQGANSNTIDFSNVPVGLAPGCIGPPCSLVINVSGTTTSTGTDKAVLLDAAGDNASVYSFGTGGAAFTNFIGATGGDTTFDGGVTGISYTGQGSGNTLDFSGVLPTVATNLTFDVTHSPNPQATLGELPEAFSGITNLVGLSGGNTEFVGGSTGGYTFKGKGAGNQATFTPEGPSTTLTVAVSPAAAISGGTVSFVAGTTLCAAAPIVSTAGGSTATCIANPPVAAGTPVTATYTPPSGSTVSGSTAVVTPIATTGKTATTTSLQIPPTVDVGKPATLTATVTSATGQPAGTVTFSNSGVTLCGAVPIVSGTASCSPTFGSVGTLNVTATFTPSSSSFVTSSATAPVVVGLYAPTTTSVSLVGCFFDCDVQATVTSSTGSNLPAGTLDLFEDGSATPVCTESLSGGAPSSGTVDFGCFVTEDGEQAEVVYIPTTPTVSGSAGIATTSEIFTRGSTTTSLVPAITTATVGIRTTFSATVSSANSPISGGTLTFSVAGSSSPLCTGSVQVSGSTLTGTCSTSFASAGSDDILAVYTPPSGATYSGSATQQALTVDAPTVTSATLRAASQATPGVLVNLSGTTDPVSPTNPVSVGTGQVLVAAAPTGITSCSGTPLPSFCDNLSGITLVNGSGLGSNTFVAGAAPQTFGDAGAAGGDAIDFSHVSTSPAAPLTVNTSGAFTQGLSNDTATTGSGIYSFTGTTSTGASDFTTFTGSNGGYTSFFAGANPNYHFTAIGSNDSIDFSAVPSGVNVDLADSLPATPTSGTVQLPAPLSGTDTINGLTTVTGSNAGGNTFSGGGAPGVTYAFTGNANNNTFVGGVSADTFTGGGSQDDFVAGPGSDTINATGGTKDTIDFSALKATSLMLNATSAQVGGTGPGTALASNSSTYTFTSLGSSAITFDGAPGGTTFYAGTVSDTYNGAVAAGVTNTLSFATGTPPGPLVVCVVAGSVCSQAGQATLGTVNEGFSNIQDFDGLATGNTTFVAGNTGGDAFTATGTGNVADFTPATAPITANLANSSVQVTGVTGSDTISGISTVIGSHVGGNTFDAAAGNETFGDNGSIGGDIVNFNGVPVSSTAPLTINVSGAPVAGTGNVTVNNDTATAGSFLYSFGTKGTDFTKFFGAGNGNTAIFAGPTSGYQFTATGISGNSISFAEDPYLVAVDLTAASNNVTLGGPSGGSDTVSGFTTVIGPNVGGSSFKAGSGSVSFTASGNANTFTGGAGTDAFTATGNGNDFKVGTGGGPITDPGSSNTIDFSAVGQGLIVNVSGGQVGAVPNSSAQAAASYTFSPVQTTFDGTATGGTTFYAGALPDTFNGKSATGDVLSFADAASNGPLAICVVADPNTCLTGGQAVLGSVKEPFSGIETFDGLAIGNTTFVAGNNQAGYTFAATGTANTADFTKSTAPITANLVAGTVCIATCSAPGTPAIDNISGITSVVGSSGGGNTFTAGPGAETFGDSGTKGGDAIDFSGVTTSSSTPLTINVSGTALGGTLNDTAAVGSTIYSFTNGGANFVKFTGSGNGFTHFDAARSTVGYSFCADALCSASGAPPGDTADFSANLTGITADVVTGKVSYVGTPTVAPGATCTPTCDTVEGMATIVGSPVGVNAYFGGLTGTNFTATGSNNTLSYVDYGGTKGVLVNLNSDNVSPLSGGTGTADTFAFSPGALTIQGSTGNDHFVIGSAAANIEGGGGQDTLDLSAIPAPTSGTTGVAVNLNTGMISGSSIGGVTFNDACGPATSLCPASITGSRYDDTFIANGGVTGPLTIAGNGGNDTLDLSAVPSAATVTMPLGSTLGTATSSSTSPITFSGIPNVVGTSPGADDFVVGSGTASFTENGATPATLDYSKVGLGKTAGVTINVSGTGGVGTTTSPALGVTNTFTGIGTFIGTPSADNFDQTGPGTYTFEGGLGNNIVNLSGVASQATVNLVKSMVCPGLNDGTAISTDGEVNDTFQCVSQVITGGTQTFIAGPGQTATLNGGGTGDLELLSPTGGVTISLPVGTTDGQVTGGGYDFSFTGMSIVNGTTFNDLFYPGSGNVTINGGGGDDGVSFGTNTLATPTSPPAAAVVNLGNAPYTIPAGLTGAGNTVAGDTATGGYGGTITLQGITNVIGTSKYNDIIVGGSGPGSLIGGSGNDRFVPTGGDDYINGGTGSATMDLSLLTGQTALNLANGGPQSTGDGTLTVVPGTIKTVIASPGGSQLQAGNGNNITLDGGAGNDWLAAGTGNQTLVGGGGTDTLVAGNGTDTLEGGAQPVTFVPGQGNDTLVGQSTGNTLSYATAPTGVDVNLSPTLFTVPPGEPMSGTLAGLSATGGSGASVNLAQANVTTVVGSPEADVLITGTGGDAISGGGGSDLIISNSGNNTLSAGTGSASRFLLEGAGSNVINGGGAATLDLSQASAGVSVNLQTGTATGGFGGFQSLTGILNVIGTNFNDALVAGAPGGTMTGLGATAGSGDFLEAGPNGGDTLVSSGSGDDTFCASSLCAISGTVAGGGDTMLGGTGDDTFYARNNVVDTISGGGGYDQAQVDAADRVTGISVLLP